MSYILGIEKDFKFFLDEVNKDNNTRISSIKDFNKISENCNFSNKWKAETILRINSICASGSDFFPRWFQLNKRGIIVGMPTTGAGGGTDEFTLSETKCVISIPLRERIITEDLRSIEGNPVLPDIFTDKSIVNIMKQIIN